MKKFSLVLCLLSIPTLIQCEHNSSILVYVGTYTGRNVNDSKGIYAFAFDSKNSSLKPLGLVAITQNPTFLLIHPSRRYILSVNEVENGMINSFKINSTQTAELLLIDQKSTNGTYPIYVSSDRIGNFIFVANYLSGSITVLAFNTSRGHFQCMTGAYQQTGSSVDPESQLSSHPHSILLDKKEEYAISADLGSDELYVYRFMPVYGKLEKQYNFKSIQAGDGPRHIVFDNKQSYIYVINELSSSITTFKYDSFLRPIQTVSTIPKNFTSTNYAAEILIHPVLNNYIYASNRGHDSIAVFTIDFDTGHLTNIQYVHVQGRTPRHFNIIPDGTHLIVANQDTNNLIVFSIDLVSGKLTLTEGFAQVSKPTYITFLMP